MGSKILYTENDNLEDKSGDEIYNMDNIEEEIKKFSKSFRNWYFY
jgi:hypothetical protein